MLFHALLLLYATVISVTSFSFSPFISQRTTTSCSTTTSTSSSTRLFSSAPSHQEEDASEVEDDDDNDIQWDLFQKHHAKGSWKGVWTSYNYIGDVIDETVASVNLDYNEMDDTIQQTHTVVTGGKVSDCTTCFDSMETKTLPVATYSKGQLNKSRCASVGMVNGPSLLRSGAMATELILCHGDGRIRVIFQHAPVWEAGIEPGSCPPQGLKLFRTVISREALRENPPTPDNEKVIMEAQKENDNNNSSRQKETIFFRGVPPFAWHKKWSGTSWTWGPSTGNRGWSIEEMDEVDSWHGRPTGDNANVWCLRLPGGVLLQGPRVVTDGDAGICRLAWMPNDDTLLRIEASVLALEPMISIESDELVGFFPPSLGSLRCDILENMGELETVPVWVKEQKDEVVMPVDENEAMSKQQKQQQDDNSSSDENSSGLDAVRDALQF